MCAANALQEMLLYTEKDIIEVFPAIPEIWKSERISFGDFLGERGIAISAEREGGALKSLTLKPKFSGSYVIRKNFDFSRYEIKPGAEYIERERTITLKLTAGIDYTLSLKADIKG